jgi:hypothetical protein
MDGFDTYNSATDLTIAYFTVTGDSGGDNTNSIGFSTTAGRFGGGAVNFSNQDNMFLKSFQNPLTNIWIGNAFNIQTSSSQNSLFYNYLSIYGYEAQITFNSSTGLWAIWLGNDTFITNPTNPPIAQGNYSITNNSWHWIETQYKIGYLTGSSQLWVDGIQVWNVSNVTTNSSIATTFYSIIFGSNQSATACVVGYFDDLYIIDSTDGGYNTTRLGDCRIETLLPSSDAGPNDGTPLSGSSHYAMVNEAQNNSGNTYVTLSGIPGQEEVYGTTQLSSIPEYIFGVRVVNVVEKTDGGITYGNAVCRSGNVTVYGNTQPILSGYFPQFGIFELDPNVSNVWTYSTVNAADVGFSVTS